MLTVKQQATYDMFLYCIENKSNYFLSSEHRNVGKTYIINELALTLQALGYKVFALVPYRHTEYFAERFISTNPEDYRGRLDDNCVVIADEERFKKMSSFLEYCEYRKVPVVGFVNYN